MTNSKQWLNRQARDQFVQAAKAQGYRSRAAFKLKQLQDSDRIFKPGMVVVDLGAAPGGWSQVAAECVGSKGRVLALDILPLDSLSGVESIQGDFSEEAVYAEVCRRLEGRLVDVVLSDMSPNLSGHREVDQVRTIGLVELAWDFAKTMGKPGGIFVAKCFQGVGFEALIAQLRKETQKLCIRKPKASRSESREQYIVGWISMG